MHAIRESGYYGVKIFDVINMFLKAGTDTDIVG